MKKRDIGLLAMGVAMAGMLFSCRTVKEKPEEAEGDRYSYDGFSIRVPQGWNTTIAPFQNMPLFMEKENGDGGVISVSEAKSNMSLEAFLEAREADFAQQINGFEKIHSFGEEGKYGGFFYKGEDDTTFVQVFNVVSGEGGWLYGATGDYTTGDSAEIVSIVMSLRGESRKGKRHKNK